MSREWTCEGCGVRSKERKIDELRWIRITITPREGRPIQDAEYELCPNCQLRLLEFLNPTNWLVHDEHDRE